MIICQTVTVGTTPTKLTLNQTDYRPGTNLSVCVPAAAGAEVWIVTGSTGTIASTDVYPYLPGTEHHDDLQTNPDGSVEDMWAVVAAGTIAVYTKQSGA